MSMNRKAARRDGPEKAIADTLRASGWSVLKISDTGAPDLLAAHGGHLVLIEVKASKGTLTKAQVKWHANWKGPKPLVFRTADDALSFHRALFVDDPYRKV